MTPQELKNSILQLAIQGKLVEQRAEEGTGKELLEKILAAKDAKKNLTRSRGARGGCEAGELFNLPKAAKSQSEKFSATSIPSTRSALSASPREGIPDDEKPFDIPKSWEWVRLGDISSVITKGTTPRGGNVSYSDKGVGFLRAENIAGLDALDKSNLKYIDEETHFGILRRSILEENDILITIAGTLGRTAIVRNNDLPLNANQAVSMIRLVDAKTVNLKYIIIALNSPVVQRLLTKQKKVTAIPNLTLGIIGDCMFPLPPLAEQMRIVAKIEELLPLIDCYEKAWSRLEDFSKRFPADMQKSLLQLAIQGKLVEQKADEGTGAELLEKIFAAKNAEGAKGKGEKSHAKSAKFAKVGSRVSREEIPDDEKPFDIPKSWEWVRLGVVVDVRDGTHDTPKYVQAGVPLVTSKNLVSGTIDFTNAKFISYEDSKAINIRSGVDDGDVLFAMIGTIGNPVLIRKDREFSIKNMALFKPIDRGLFCMEYLMMFLTKAQFDMRKSASASVQSFVSLSFLRNYPIPLPPLAEQKRIVAKLEELLPLCERLK